jgi:HSP90 family molecular chaperone
MSGDPIIVTDNGSGMTTQEVASEYLVVASDGRTRKGEITLQKQRKVKGRKGIGKFAGLMAADVMKVPTRARGKETTLTISKQDLIGAKTRSREVRHPH